MDIHTFSLRLLLVGIFMLSLSTLEATHNRAGEITYKQIGPLTFEVTVTTYTKASSVPADRDSLEFCWGDGSCQFVGRTNGNGQGVILGNDIKLNTYTATHTYPGRATYTISMTDPNRNGGILNVNPPNSDQIQFHLETELTILNGQFQGQNNSPILLEPPIDVGYVNQPFFHNPNAYDIEGDSIAYELIVPLQAVGTQVTNYSFPNAIGAQPQTINLDPITGQFSWFTPQQAGEYNIAILVKEYRAGQLITAMIRDMQITIKELNNRPPTIENVQNICVVAGDTIDFDVISNDPDAGQKIIVTASGGPLLPAGQFFAPAQFIVPSGYNTPTVTGTFRWETKCEHIQDQPYQIVFKAQDDFEDTIGASSFMVVRIKVVGPPPDEVQAEVNPGQVEVTWQSPYTCDAAPEFRGFQVWRREGSNPFTPDSCETGLMGRGYTQIAKEIIDIDNGRFIYTDTDVERGRFYCYRIVAEFAEINPAGFAFNFAESIPSEEVCVQMSRDLPLITNVTVEDTDDATGKIQVRWSKPSADDLDTLQNPGTYVYKVYRSPDLGGSNLVEVASFTSNTFAGANDTIFNDINLNTVNSPYSYQIEFLVQGNVAIGTTETASSVFLEIASTDQTNILSWNEQVPWENSDYIVYRFNENTNQFDSIGVSKDQTFSDTGLQNEKEYCYYIRSIGSYNIPGVIDPIINLSQEACGTPIDTVPPCPPTLTVTNRCLDENFSGGQYENFLSWIHDDPSCANDVENYKIYYAPATSAAFENIITLNNDNFEYFHELSLTLAGCYYVTALDSLGNESVPSNIVCLDNCPNYELPNVFTPNNDGVNELFVPFPYQFVDRINLKVVNRWGELVYQTSDPDINWNGTNLNGKLLADGVYFYTCEVFEVRLDGVVQSPMVLTGYIHLIRNGR